jgi:hypothetical protein
VAGQNVVKSNGIMINYISQIKHELNSNFNWKSDKKSNTQDSAEKTQLNTKNCFDKVIGHIAFFWPNPNTQLSPDGIIGPISVWPSIKKFNKTWNRAGDTSKKRKKDPSIEVIKDWEKSEFNTDKIKLIRVEDKANLSGTVYRINKHVLKSDGETLFITTYGGNKKHIHMLIESDIYKKYPEAVGESESLGQIFDELERTLKEKTSNFKCHSTIRLLKAIGINSQYMNIDSSDEDIEKLFNKAGIYLQDNSYIVETKSFQKEMVN